MALFFFVVAGMAADLFPKMALFMHEVEQRYPKVVESLNKREQYVIDCYDRLPARIRAGFSVLGGKQAWAWLVRAGNAYLLRNRNRK